MFGSLGEVALPDAATTCSMRLNPGVCHKVTCFDPIVVVASIGIKLSVASLVHSRHAEHIATQS